jgi:hypothetical protein
MSRPLTALPATDVRARRHPLTLLSVYFTELFWALLVATPVHAWARSTWGAHPDGDAVLWRAGARELMAWVNDASGALPIVSRTVVVLLVVGAVAMQMPLGAMLTALGFAEPKHDASPPRRLRFRTAMQTATRAFLPLCALWLLHALCTIVTLVIGVVAANAVGKALTHSLGDAHAFMATVVVFCLFALVASLLGVTTDLARASLVGTLARLTANERPRSAWKLALAAARNAIDVTRRKAVGTTLGWSGRTLAGLALVGLGALVSHALGGRAGASLILLGVVHQAIVFARVALRASWLARALSFVSAARM